MLSILENILNDIPNRKKLVFEFQNLIWNEEIEDENLNDLAYDMDFYEPDEKKRKEDPSYYGDEELEKLIKETIKKINS